jgi:hypothetical protein
MAQHITRILGKTILGLLGRGPQQILHITASPTAEKPGILALDSVDDDGAITTYFLWVDQNGDLRVGSAIPTDEDSDGTIVGTQS